MITVDNAFYSFNGDPNVDANVYFYSTLWGGGFAIGPDGNDLNIGGAQLFSGSLPDPTFLTGDFTLVGAAGTYNVMVTTPDHSETATIVVLLCGLMALAGVAIYRQRMGSDLILS